MRGCADRDETWIDDKMLNAYLELHRLGFAYSVEVWDEKDLVGGLYGVKIGSAFFAESMFSRKTNASKFAVYQLTQNMRKCGMQLLEVQFITTHLQSLGAIAISDEEYQKQLRKAVVTECPLKF